MQAGIDEAGRGPVMGPLVVAGVAAPEPATLAAMGCRDSKELSPRARERLFRMLHDDSDVKIAVEIIEAHEIDGERAAGQTLNVIERHRFAAVARNLGAPVVVVDAADIDAARFGRQLAAELPDDWRITSEHRADARHPTVAAASIVAKVTRDRAIADLARRLERKLDYELGSGYPSDPKTKLFLAAWFAQFGDLPEGTRTSWKTARQVVSARQQSSLGGFGDA